MSISKGLGNWGIPGMTWGERLVRENVMSMYSEVGKGKHDGGGKWRMNHAEIGPRFW